jgi:hypothetical protein
MAVNSMTYNYDQYLTATALNYRNHGEFYDNIFLMNPTMWFLHEKGRKVEWDGGGGDGRVVVNLQYGKNSTFGAYSRFDPIDVSPQDNQTAVHYDMKQFGGAISIDRFHVRCNRGKSQLQKILKVKINEAEMTLAEEINTSLWQLTPATDDINGIPYIITISPDAADTDIGGIAADAAGNSWWQNKFRVGGPLNAQITTWAVLDFRMLHMYNDCTKGAAKRTSKGSFIGNAPDLLMMNQETYEAYESGMMQRSRYESPWTKKAASYGFGGLAYKNATCMWDEMVADPNAATSYPTARVDGAIYFINTTFLEYQVDPGTDLLIEPFVKPHNLDARTALVLHYHQLTCSNRSKQGVLSYIDVEIAS